MTAALILFTLGFAGLLGLVALAMGGASEW